MRLFKLINSLGEELSLNRNDLFFHAPDGLGRSRDQNYKQTGDFLIRTENTFSPQNITGTLFLWDYAQFSEFAAFVEREPLIFCYSPTGTVWYYKDCVCIKLGKTEKEPNTNHLMCDVDFLPLSLWYDNTRVYKTEQIEPSANLFVFPFTFPFTFFDSGNGDVNIKNARPREAPCKITFYGPLVNPEWTLTSGGMTIMSGAIEATLLAGERLVIDANPQTMEVTLYDTDDTPTDYSQYLDFSLENFVYAPHGDSVLSVTHEGIGEINVMVEVKQYADAV